MNAAKLTLSVPKDILAAAKAYSRKTGKSLSGLVARYFSLLAEADSKRPVGKVGRLSGVIKGAASRDDDELLYEALKEKYDLPR